MSAGVENLGRQEPMMNSELSPWAWRDIPVLRAQGVLAEVLVVDLVEADHGLRAHAYATGTPVHEVARQVCDRELLIDRELCVMIRSRSDCTALERSTNAFELARGTYLSLVDTADALAGTYDRIAETRDAHARETDKANPRG